MSIFDTLLAILSDRVFASPLQTFARTRKEATDAPTKSSYLVLRSNAARRVTAARARNGECRRKKIQFPANRAFPDPRLILCRVTSALFGNWKPRSLRNSFTHTPLQDYAITFAKKLVCGSPFLNPFSRYYTIDYAQHATQTMPKETCYIFRTIF